MHVLLALEIIEPEYASSFPLSLVVLNLNRVLCMHTCRLEKDLRHSAIPVLYVTTET